MNKQSNWDTWFDKVLGLCDCFGWTTSDDADIWMDCYNEGMTPQEAVVTAIKTDPNPEPTEKELYVSLSEECGEVTIASSKCFRFGKDSGWNGSHNGDDLLVELNDLIAVADMLVAYGVLPKDWQRKDLQEQKKKKIRKFLKISRENGG